MNDENKTAENIRLANEKLEFVRRFFKENIAEMTLMDNGFMQVAFSDHPSLLNWYCALLWVRTILR